MRKKQKRNELEKPFFYALCMPCDQITTPLRGGMRRLHALCTLHTTRDDEIRTPRELRACHRDRATCTVI